MALTRRHFLERVAAAGGAPLVYEAMTGLGLLAVPTPTRFDLRGQVSGVRVLVLGEGLAGLTVAYELGKRGYRCQITQIVYPSSGFHGRKGIVIGYYIQGDAGRPMGDRSPAERQAMALEQGGRIHPQYRGDFETAFSVGWHRVTWIRGSWVSFSADIRRELPTLRRPDGRVYLAGDHVSGMNAWMQGALESARDVAAAIHARATQEVRTVGA